MWLTAIVLFIVGMIELYQGAIQLGLMNSPIATKVSYELLLVCCAVITYVFSTLLGDRVVYKRFGYKIDRCCRGRWEEHTGGGGDGFEPAPGIGIRLLLHFLMQTSMAYIALLLVRS